MRPIRNRDPETYRLITIRTSEARLWLTPSSNVAKLVGGVLARYQELLEIVIYAYCFLGNHFHLLIKAPKGNTDEFCENVNREIARRLNWHHKRVGQFWGRRYDDQAVLSEDDLLEAFLYINTNPTRHGLVADSSEWSGLNSFKHSIDERDRTFSFRHYSEEGHPVTSHKLKISPLPQFEGLTGVERKARVQELLNARQASLVKAREDRNQGFLGLSAVRSQTPGEKPIASSSSPRPHCYSKSPLLIREFRKSLRQRRLAYWIASVRYRLGVDAVFPEHSFKPPLHRLPRLTPFQLMTIAHLKTMS
ncbi:MAG: transposase [Oligoflexia bacterium]|nr:transposase [Oligoflexia bacterium]